MNVLDSAIIDWGIAGRRSARGVSLDRRNIDRQFFVHIYGREPICDQCGNEINITRTPYTTTGHRNELLICGNCTSLIKCGKCGKYEIEEYSVAIRTPTNGSNSSEFVHHCVSCAPNERHCFTCGELFSDVHYVSEEGYPFCGKCKPCVHCTQCGFTIEKELADCMFFASDSVCINCDRKRKDFYAEDLK